MRPAEWTPRRARPMRLLRLEALEDRRLLVASPWHNAALALDVNGSGEVTAADAAGVVSALLVQGVGPLPAPDPNPPLLYLDVNDDNALSPRDALMVINRLLNPTAVTLSTLVPFSIDTTPSVSVSATSSAALPDGTLVSLDVDLNNDGDFSDAGETARTMAPLYQGTADFTINPALPVNGESGPYTVRLRARVTDSEGVEGTSTVSPMIVDTQMSSALDNYVHAADPSYHYSVANTVVGPGYTFYAIDMTSQTWRSSADVDKPVWRHWVEVVVPTGTLATTALLYINGGNNNFGSPPSAPDPNTALLAVTTHTVVINLRTVPSEPLTFTDETSGRSEDEIIAYSFDKYMDNIGAPGNETWPVLLAMANSAVKTMDTIQNFIPQVTGNQTINDFIVTGYSKRGWTTWLTAAADDRVRAIIPGVFDNLDQGPQMVHHYQVYGFFSEAVQDYSDMHIFDRIMTPEGQQLSKIVDPYRYLRNGRFDNMPKLILNSAGDEFFVSDSSQFYIHDLPGTQNYLRYFPNTGHGLDGTAVTSTLTFLDAILNNRHLPEYSWTIQPNGAIELHTTDTPLTVKLWQATNPTARDFRRTWHPEITWTSTTATNLGNGIYSGNVPLPNTGATAYFLEMTYPSGIGGTPFVFTTEIHVKSTLPLSAWPFDSGFPSGGAAVVSDNFDYLANGDLAAALAAAGELPEDESALSGVAFALSLAAPPSSTLSSAPAIVAPTEVSSEPQPVSATAGALAADQVTAAFDAADDQTDWQSDPLEFDESLELSAV